MSAPATTYDELPYDDKPLLPTHPARTFGTGRCPRNYTNWPTWHFWPAERQAWTFAPSGVRLVATSRRGAHVSHRLEASLDAVRA
jgi:hypothetical protein